MAQGNILLTNEQYTPQGKQKDVHASRARIIVFEAGRGCGKSRCLIWQAYILYMRLRKQARPITVIPKLHFWFMAPNYPQAEQLWLEIKRFIDPRLWTRDPNEADKRLWLEDDCLIEVKSAHDPNSLQTPSLDFLGITESDNVADDAWFNISPALARESRSGYVMAEGRPVKANSWFSDLGKAGRDPENKEVEYIHWTSLDSPFIDQKRVDLDKKFMTDKRWRMEYLAERGASEKAAFNNVRGCIKGNIDEPIEGNTYAIGYDVGLTESHSVFIVMDTSRRRVVDHLCLTKYNTVLQKNKAISLCEKWNDAYLIMDASGLGIGLYEDLRLESNVNVKGVVFSRGAKSSTDPKIKIQKDKLYSELMVAVERETISYPNIPALIEQLENCEIEEGIDRDKIGAPKGKHDDYVAALALALSGCASTGGQTRDQILTGYF